MKNQNDSWSIKGEKRYLKINGMTLKNSHGMCLVQDFVSAHTKLKILQIAILQVLRLANRLEHHEFHIIYELPAYLKFSY